MNINQFKPAAQCGDLDLVTCNTDTVTTFRFYSATSTATIIPGEGVKLVDLGSSDTNGVPFVGKVTSDNETQIEGLLIRSSKKAEASVNDTVEIAGDGAVMWLKAGEAISRGAKVALDISNPGYVVAATDESVIGRAYDKAAAEDDLIRVKVKFEYVEAAST